MAIVLQNEGFGKSGRRLIVMKSRSQYSKTKLGLAELAPGHEIPNAIRSTPGFTVLKTWDGLGKKTIMDALAAAGEFINTIQKMGIDSTLLLHHVGYFRIRGNVQLSPTFEHLRWKRDRKGLP